MRGDDRRKVGVGWGGQPCLVKGSVVLRGQADQSLTASWQFWEENPPPTILPSGSHTSPPQMASEGVRRWGCMVVTRGMQAVEELVGRALEEAQGGTPGGMGNLVHVAVMGEEDRWVEGLPATHCLPGRSHADRWHRARGSGKSRRVGAWRGCRWRCWVPGAQRL